MIVSREDRIVYIKTAIIVSTTLLFAMTWMWWVFIHTSKEQIFNQMFDKSLSTTGVTKVVSQGDSSNKLVQRSQSQYGPSVMVNVNTEINQSADGNDVTVVTESIGTPRDSYVRYKHINVGTNQGSEFNFDSVLGKWGRVAQVEGGSEIFTESVYGVVPFGNLPQAQRKTLLDKLHGGEVYKADFSKTESSILDGRSVYVYEVEINVQRHVELVKAYDGLMGLGLLSDLESERYSSYDPLVVKMHIDKGSRQLLKLEFVDNDRVELFEGHGIQRPLVAPEDYISRSELEVKLQEVLSSQ